MSLAITLDLEMQTDWHIGTGAGHGPDLDREVLRDPAGVVFVPARTLLGVWRDAAEALGGAMDAAWRDARPTTSEPGMPAASWLDVVDVVFGEQPAVAPEPTRSPRAGRVQATAAALAPAIHAAFAASAALREAATLRSPSVAIDESTGAAAEEKYFITELVRAGTCLRAEATIDTRDWSPETIRRVASFVKAAAVGIHAIGGRRRRGRGRCRVRVHGEADATDGLAELVRGGAPRAADLVPTAPPAHGEGEGPCPRPEPRSVPATWSAWTLDVTTIEPLLVQGDLVGNVLKGADHVPGAVLLAALGRHVPAGSRAAWRQAIRSGGLRVGFARPQVRGESTLPMPLAVHVLKGRARGRRVEAQVRRILDDPPGSAERSAPSNPSVQPQQVRSGWAIVPDAPAREWQHVETPRTRRTHNVITDDVQRPTSALGGVFTYDAIAAGVTLRAFVRARADAAELVASALPLDSVRQVRLGRARKADYGLVTLSAAPHSEAASVPAAASGRLLLLLASPLLLRDERLDRAAGPEALEAELRRALGAPDLRVDRSCSVLRPWRLTSWHGGWGLPRPEFVGLAPGGVVVVRGAERATAAALGALAQEGLGERRVEGFGEVVVDPAWLRGGVAMECLLREEPARSSDFAPRSSDLELLAADPWGHAVLDVAAGRAVARSIASRLSSDAAQGAVSNPLRGVSASQLGDLRTALVQAGADPDVTGLATRWLARQQRKVMRRGGQGSRSAAHLERGLAPFLSLAGADVWAKALGEEAAGWSAWVRDDTKLARTWGPRVLARLIIEWCRPTGRPERDAHAAPQGPGRADHAAHA